jgi:uncharacterized membrane protein
VEGLTSIPPYLFHPMVVHFPIALLTLGLAAAVVALSPRSPAWLRPAVDWVLGLGTLALWVTLGLGLLAEDLAPHVPAAWRVMASHKQHAWITAAAFSSLCLLWAWSKGRWRPWLTLLWALCCVSLALTAHLGARLVFDFGVGSAQP